VFRIAQEAVSNAVRHGKAGRITIALERCDGRVRLVICDNGQGAGPDPSSGGMGLRIMGFRAKMIRAALDIGEAAGGGCQVTLTIPEEVAEAA